MPRSSLVRCLFTLGALGVLGCGSSSVTLDPDGGPSLCVGVSCSGHGTCWSDGTRARCECESGFVAVGLECQVAGPCAPNPCLAPHRTVCTATGTSATCSCEPGYVEQEGACIKAVSCEPNPCSAPHRTACSVAEDGVRCACDVRYHDDGAGSCVADDPCWNNPCLEPHRTVCRALGATVICSCDEGFWDQGTCVPAGSCSPNPCTQPHRSVCGFDGKSVSCGCDAGFVDDGKGGCVAKDPCLPNPCTGAHRTVCQASGATVICSCEAGYWDRQGACVPAASCSPNPCSEAHRSVCSSDGETVACGCDPGFAEDGAGRCAAIDPCQPNPCFEVHRGLCRVVGGAAVCACDSGYWDQGGCVPAVSCTPNPCTTPHQSVCSIDQASVVCACDPGYRANGAGGCAVIDPCQPNPCTGDHRSVCRTSGSAAICSCDVGFVDDGQGACVDACNPNPCKAPHQGVCTAGPTGVRCGCEVGYVDDGSGGCRFQTPPDCPTAHDSGDAYEPDECPSLARVVTLPLSETHTLNLANDADWIAFDAKAGKAYVATVKIQNAGIAIDFLSTTNQVLATRSYSYGGSLLLAVHPGAGRTLLRLKPTGTVIAGSTYTLELKEVDDDVPNTASGAVPLAIGNTTPRALEYVTDEDWFSFSTVPDHGYRITVSCGGELVFSLWDVAGASNPSGSSALASQSSYGGSSSFTWKAPASATFFLRVQASYSSSGGNSYSLTVEDIGLDDHGDTAATATELSLGTPQSGISAVPTDVDYFRFSGIPGHIYRVTVVGTTTSAATLFDVDRSSTLDTGDGTTVTLSLKSASVAPYYLVIRPYTYNAGSPYTVLLEDLGLDDYGDSFADASPISPAAPISGTLQFRRDSDFFSLSAVSGHVYKIELSAPSQYTSFALYQSDGKTLIASGNPIVFGAAGAGPYYLGVARDSYSSWLTSVTTYTVTVTDQGSDDHGGSAAAATRLVLGAATAGALDYAADRDWFVFAATASHVYALTVVPSGPTVGVSLYANDGTTVLGSASSSPALSMRVRATSTGDLHVEVYRDGYYSTTLGPYMVQVVDLGPDDHGDAYSEGTPLSPGTAVSGNLQVEGDADWFALATTAGRIYRCTVSPVGFTARARLVASDGHSEIGNLSGYQPLSLTFQASVSGNHYLAVLGGITGATGTYSVLAEDLGVDDVGDSTATATAVTVGDPATSGAIQFSSDVDVFSFVAAAGALSPKLTLTGAASVNVKVTTSTGTSVLSNKGPGTHPLTLPSAGTYYVTVSSPTLAMGSYSVQLVP